MEEKNELNDLFLGEENKNNGSKKLFLIVAGALLVFFVTIGIMKFVNSGEEKPQNTNSTKTMQAQPKEVNGSADAGTVPNDEKLNEIVRKLQEDAKNQAVQSSPLDANSTPTIQTKTTAVPVPVPTQTAPVPKPAEQKPAPTPIQTTPQSQVKTITPVQTIRPKADSPSTTPATTPKEALKEATKTVVKPKPTPKPKPAIAKSTQTKSTAEMKAESQTSAGESYYVQVGYFDGQKNVTTLNSKASAIGFKTINRQAQVKDKNVTKVLIGPFNSKTEAQTELTKIRQQLKSDAFITK